MNRIGRFPGGTRFRLYALPAHLGSPAQLETVTLSSPAGSLSPGPADHRMYAIRPLGKEYPYGFIPGAPGQGLYLPPWDGPIVAPPMSSPGGHFDHIDPEDPAFLPVHLFGAARFTLDVWESYLREEVPWHFRGHFRRLELSMIDSWANASMGYGFLETGARRGKDGDLAHYALNFDIIAHEIGHAILVAMTGPFAPDTVPADFQAFHEVSADWVSLITSLHFDSVLDELLDNTKGNLDTYNRLSRFGEFSSTEQIRLANNEKTMADYAFGWKSEHHLAKPLIAALFDMFVDIYHEILVEERVVSPALEDLADRAEYDPTLLDELQIGFERAFDRRPEVFRAALEESRDLTAEFLISIWERIEKERFRFALIPTLVDEIDRELTGGRLKRIATRNFQLRGLDSIPAGPRLGGPDPRSHAHSARMLAP